jgi:hypothetical protein
MFKQLIAEFRNQDTDTLEVILMTNTPQPTSAKFKDVLIRKQSAVYATLHKHNTYREQVIESAVHLKDNESTNVSSIVDFKPNQTIYLHDPEAYCLLEHPVNHTLYLYVTVNSSSSSYFVDGVETSKEDVLQYMTPSVQKAMTKESVTHNLTNDIKHDVKVVTYKLNNIQSIQFLHNKVIINNTDWHIS